MQVTSGVPKSPSICMMAVTAALFRERGVYVLGHNVLHSCMRLNKHCLQGALPLQYCLKMQLHVQLGSEQSLHLPPCIG